MSATGSLTPADKLAAGRRKLEEFKRKKQAALAARASAASTKPGGISSANGGASLAKAAPSTGQPQKTPQSGVEASEEQPEIRGSAARALFPAPHHEDSVPEQHSSSAPEVQQPGTLVSESINHDGDVSAVGKEEDTTKTVQHPPCENSDPHFSAMLEAKRATWEHNMLQLQQSVDQSRVRAEQLEQENAILSRDLDRALRELETTDADRTRVLREHSQLVGEMVFLRTQAEMMDGLRGQMTALEEEKTQLQASLREQESLFANATSVTHTNEDYAKLEQKMAALEHAVQASAQELDVARQETEVARQEAEDAWRESAEAQGQVEELEASVTKLTQQVESERRSRGEFRERVEALSAELEVARSEDAAAAAELENVREQCAEWRRAADAATTESQDLQREIGTLKLQRSEAETNLEFARAELESLRATYESQRGEQVEELAREADSLRIDLESTRAETAVAVETAEDALSRAAEAEAEAERLRLALEQEKALREGMVVERDALMAERDSLAQQVDDRADAGAALADLQTELSRREESLGRLESELIEAKATASAVAAEERTVREGEMLQLEQELMASGERVEALETEMQAAQSEKTAAQAAKEAAEADVASARNELAVALHDLAMLRAASRQNEAQPDDAASHDIALLQEQLHRSEEATKRERDNVAELRRQLEAQRVRCAKLETAASSLRETDEDTLRALQLSSTRTIDSLLKENESLARRVNDDWTGHVSGLGAELRSRGTLDHAQLHSEIEPNPKVGRQAASPPQGLSFWSWLTGADLVNEGSED